MSTDETVLTREELYSQVWTTPIRRLAERYGVSDVGLAKICKKHEIPRPPVGYWAKKEFGKNVTQPPLPSVKDMHLLKVCIHKTLTLPVEPQLAVNDPELLKLIERESDPKHRIMVPLSVRSPHPVVAETQLCFQDARPDQYGKIRPLYLDRLRHLDVRVTKSSLSRVLRILDALAKALEKRGHKFETHGDGWRRATYLSVFGERLRIQVLEKARQIDRTPTEEEKRFGSLHSRPKYDYIGTGLLELRLIGENGHELHTWRDGKSKLENRLNDFVIAAYTAVERQREGRRWQEQLEIKRREDDQRRWEEERRCREEAARRKQLEEMAASRAKALQIRAFISAVRESRHAEVSENVSPLSAWLSWADRQADLFDPLAGSNLVEKLLRKNSQ